MPARRARVFIFPEEPDQPCRSFDCPFWWDMANLFESYRHRQVEIETLVDINYAVLLTGYEAVDWDERARAQYWADPGISTLTEKEVRQKMAQVEMRLRTAEWVIVYLYEWESGLD